MRRYAAALAPVAMAPGTAACSPDLVRVPTDTPAPQSADTAATALGLYGLDYSGRASRYTLMPHDVWPTVTKTGQAFANYSATIVSATVREVILGLGMGATALLYQAATLADR